MYGNYTRRTLYHHEVIADDIKEILDVVIVGIASCGVCVFGFVSNIINAIVFKRQGFQDAINVSFFTLAITDLGGLVSLLWSNICAYPIVTQFSSLPFAHAEVRHLTAGYPRLCFSKIACLITIFITVQRCLCIVKPLKVKILLTPRRTWYVMALFHIVVFFIVPFPTLGTGSAKLAWKHDPPNNRSILGMVQNTNYGYAREISMSAVIIFQFSSFTVLIVSTVVLVIQLGNQSKWRESAVMPNVEKTATVTKREHNNIAVAVVLLSVISIVSYIPATSAACIAFFLPGFSIAGMQANLYAFIWDVAFLSEGINSSVNVFVYYKMSSKYRSTFERLFSWNKSQH